MDTLVAHGPRIGTSAAGVTALLWAWQHPVAATNGVAAFIFATMNVFGPAIHSGIAHVITVTPF